jgi:hypothetical protein
MITLGFCFILNCFLIIKRFSASTSLKIYNCTQPYLVLYIQNSHIWARYNVGLL